MEKDYEYDDNNEKKLEEKKKLIEELLEDKKYKPMTMREMAGFMQVPKEERKEFNDIIYGLLGSGKALIDKRGHIKKAGSDVKVGRFMATKKGFAFVRVEGETQDVFVESDNTANAYDSDIVQVKIIREAENGYKPEGVITGIVERGHSVVVGTFTALSSRGVVKSDDSRFTEPVYIGKNDTCGAVSGHKVVVEILKYPDTLNEEFKGKVIEILGHINDPGVDILSIVRAYGIPDEYPEEVLAEAEKTPEIITEDDIRNRKDVRDLLTVTIDGEDAKDLDDAITLEKEGGYYHLGVHIADVSEYVKEGSNIDKEALKRGTSCYLTDRVIPMIPHRLSNGICSLNQGEDRLTLSVFMDINEKGEIVSHEISEAVIRVNRRMSYTAVKKIVEEDMGVDYFREFEPDRLEGERDEEFVTFFKLMYELKDILHKARQKDGSIDFDFPEGKITLNEEGFPIEVDIYERSEANRVIEEFMLAANKCVAEDYFWQELPFVFRSHETPSMEKCCELASLVEGFGYRLRLKDESVHPKEIQKLLQSIEGKPEEGLISMITLRSMKQARYTVECNGHFGLAFKYYCHFTSPIRRYPDLQIHRIIKENLHGELTSKRINHYEKILPDEVVRLSELERRADEAEREVMKLKKAQYMEQFIGDEFEGTVSGVTGWGIYVTLPNTVEGMISLATLYDDYYEYIEESHMLVGADFGRVYRPGDKLKVKVSAVNIDLRTIDFTLVQEEK